MTTFVDWIQIGILILILCIILYYGIFRPISESIKKNKELENEN